MIDGRIRSTALKDSATKTDRILEESFLTGSEASELSQSNIKDHTQTFELNSG